MTASGPGSAVRQAQFFLRPAAPDDVMLLFDWANRADSIATSLKTAAPIALPHHLAWFRQCLADEDTRIWIVDTPSGPAGQVRLQDSPNGAEVSIYIAAQHRGFGIAKAVLTDVAKYCRGWREHGRLLARVRRDNPVSSKLFEAVGFRLVEARTDHYLYALVAIEEQSGIETQ